VFDGLGQRAGAVPQQVVVWTTSCHPVRIVLLPGGFRIVFCTDMFRVEWSPVPKTTPCIRRYNDFFFYFLCLLTIRIHFFKSMCWQVCIFTNKVHIMKWMWQRTLSSGAWRRIVWYKFAEVSGEVSDSIFRDKE
jgi:hypothetical protein